MAIAGLLCIGRLKERKMNAVEITMIVILVGLGVATLSKSFFAGLACTVLINMFINSKFKQIIGAVGVGIVVAWFFTYLYTHGNEYVVALFERFLEGDSLEGLTSHRSVIWIGYLKTIFTDPHCLVMGEGIHAAPPASIGAVSHNVYLEVLYYTGIIGGALLVLLLRGMVKRKKRKLIQYLPLGVFLVRAFAINLFLREAFMIDLVIILLTLNDVGGITDNRKFTLDRIDIGAEM